MGQLECPLADGLDGWLDDMMEAGWLVLGVVWMTRGLASCLGLAHHASRGLGQAMCGLSSKCRGGKEGSEDLFTLAMATSEATPQFLTRQGKQARCRVSNTRPPARNDHSKHRPVNRTQRCGI